MRNHSVVIGSVAFLAIKNIAFASVPKKLPCCIACRSARIGSHLRARAGAGLLVLGVEMAHLWAALLAAGSDDCRDTGAIRAAWCRQACRSRSRPCGPSQACGSAGRAGPITHGFAPRSRRWAKPPAQGRFRQRRQTMHSWFRPSACRAGTRLSTGS